MMNEIYPGKNGKIFPMKISLIKQLTKHISTKNPITGIRKTEHKKAIINT